MKKPLYADLNSLEEDQRIDVIGKLVMGMEPGKSVAFVVEENKKADRYIAKLTAKYPAIQILKRLRNVPVKGCIAITVGRPLTKSN